MTDDELLSELLRRRRAQESLVGYSHAIQIPGSPSSSYLEDDPATWVFKPVETGVATHHIVTMEAIERCIIEPYGRLMIFEPPGSAKSTYGSVVGPTWAMGRTPGLQVLASSYADIPIERHSKRARQIAASDAYANIWDQPTRLVRGSSNASDWELTNGSRLFCGGLLGSITSTRCDLGIIDDPVKNREDANSERIRLKTKEEYQDSFLTRLKPDASIIIIQTRWHEDDLSGGILPEDYDGQSGWVKCRDGMTWYVLNIPAKAVRDDDPLGRKPGEYLWPEWFGAKHWKIFEPDPTNKDGPNPRTWSALFQQDPQPASGGQFEREWFKRFEVGTEPSGEQLAVNFGTGDWALTEKQLGTHPDYTVLGAWVLDHNGNLWLTEGWYGQNDLTETLSQYMRICRDNKIYEFVAEAGKIRRASEPMLTKLMEETKRYISMTWLPAVNDKVANVASFRARAQRGRVYVAKGPFGDYVIDQLCGFPYGRYDDAVDMCGLSSRFIDMRMNPEGPAKKEVKRQPKPGTMQYLDYEDTSESDRARNYAR